jgi:hypothetical protein
MATPKAKRRVSALRRTAKSAVQRIEKELPPELRPYARRMRQALSRLEKQLASAQQGARRSWAHLLREASHQLGRVEALGEREWRKRSTRARREAVSLLRRLEKAIEPRGVARPRRKPAKPSAARTPAPQARRAVPASRPASLPTAAPASALASITPSGAA